MNEFEKKLTFRISHYQEEIEINLYDEKYELVVMYKNKLNTAKAILEDYKYFNNDTRDTKQA